MTKQHIKTLYLTPHCHTDFGYSHDPLATAELHNRFLDRAIELCQATREFPEGAQFRWTIEVFASLQRWWQQRSEPWRERLLECLRRGEIDYGARYLNGTELYSPEDVAWEIAALKKIVNQTGVKPGPAIQNDINGFGLSFARPLADAGVNTVIMGLNTTMGHSPFPRCSAFTWDLGDDRSMLVWNGWIYNRIKTYCHLNELGEKFHGHVDDFLAGLPADYPYDFAVTSATIGDNIGPFPMLPEQVRLFNERSDSIQLKIVTFSEFAKILAMAEAPRPTFSGQWTDFWTFGAGAMPHLVGMTRRAQRRLRLVEQFRQLGWANESGGSLDMDKARQALAFTCEHTYDSHSSSGEQCGSSDALRQKAQIQIDAATAETASMVLLRDHLTTMAKPLPKEPASVLVANPHEFPLRLDYLTDEKGMRNFATSRQPEHLFQFDREPTVDALAASASFGRRDITASAETITLEPLETLAKPQAEGLKTTAEMLEISQGENCVRFDPANSSLTSWKIGSKELLSHHHEFPTLQLLQERPNGPFQVHGMGDMDPVDAAWDPALSFSRQAEVTPLAEATRLSSNQTETLELTYDHTLLRKMQLSLDRRWKNTLNIRLNLHYNADPTLRAYYLPLSLNLPGEDECDYWIDGCGTWFRAEVDQLPNTCNSFYQTHQGVAVSRGGRTIYVASPDISLFQFGGLTFGQLPHVKLQRKNPFIAIWLYNNYWGTNFPSYSPGLAQARFALHIAEGDFDPTVMKQLDRGFDADFITHPVA